MKQITDNAPAANTPCRVLSLAYFGGNLDAALERTLPFLRSRTPFSVFTPGASVAARAEREQALACLLSRADLLLADGYGCRVAARLYGVPPPVRIAGIDFAEALFSAVACQPTRVFLYGGRQGVAERAAARLSKRYPGLIFGTADGYGDDPASRIATFCPHIVCVCLGVGKQEEWIDKNKDRVGGVFMGLGGSLDVWSGTKRRAPRALQRLGLEWAWRTLREPRRIRNLLPLPGYFLKCFSLRQNAKNSAENGRRV